MKYVIVTPRGRQVKARAGSLKEAEQIAKKICPAWQDIYKEKEYRRELR